MCAGSADFRYEIIELVCDGQWAAARLRYTGIHTRVLLGLPAMQWRFEYAGAAFFAADYRFLTSAWVLGDLDGLRRQLKGLSGKYCRVLMIAPTSRGQVRRG